MNSRCDIGKAMVMLYDNYKMAMQDINIKNPVSFALYRTWQYIDRIEKERSI